VETVPPNAVAGHTNSYHSYSLEDALAGIAGAGFSGVELSAVPGWTEHVSLGDGRELRAKLDGHGLEPVSVSAHSELATPDGLDYAIRAVRWAADFGIPIMNTAIGGHASTAEDESAFLANVDRLADAADGAGVVVALEIHGELMGSGRRADPLVRRLGRESIRVNYDTANCEYYAGVKAVDDLPAIAWCVAHVHLKDSIGGEGVWNNPALGTGEVDFARVLAILAQAGYAGPYSVELEFEGEPWPPLAAVDAAMKTSYDHLRTLGLV
jgi:L-ribulose-5-phosphate 3-epimerase